MYTSVIVIYRCCGDMTFTSYGHGAAYELRKGNRSVWFEGGDAIELESEMESDDNETTSEMLTRLWDQYGPIASED